MACTLCTLEYVSECLGAILRAIESPSKRREALFLLGRGRRQKVVLNRYIQLLK
jgi:hypothetical protein